MWEFRFRFFVWFFRSIGILLIISEFRVSDVGRWGVGGRFLFFFGFCELFFFFEMKDEEVRGYFMLVFYRMRVFIFIKVIVFGRFRGIRFFFSSRFFVFLWFGIVVGDLGCLSWRVFVWFLYFLWCGLIFVVLELYY